MFGSRFFAAWYWRARYWSVLTGTPVTTPISPPPRRTPKQKNQEETDYFTRLTNSVYLMWEEINNLGGTSIGKIHPPPRNHPKDKETRDYYHRLTNSVYSMFHVLRRIVAGQDVSTAKLVSPPRPIPPVLLNDPNTRDYIVRMDDSLYQMFFALKRIVDG